MDQPDLKVGRITFAPDNSVPIGLEPKSFELASAAAKLLGDRDAALAAKAAADEVKLRDWYAGQALADVINTVGFHYPKSIAKSAFDIADAMMAERAKRRAQ